ncbi:hypothetical protein N2152v2_002636 [Parachlorella kessleri]
MNNSAAAHNAESGVVEQLSQHFSRLLHNTSSALQEVQQELHLSRQLQAVAAADGNLKQQQEDLAAGLTESGTLNQPMDAPLTGSSSVVAEGSLEDRGNSGHVSQPAVSTEGDSVVGKGVAAGTIPDLQHLQPGGMQDVSQVDSQVQTEAMAPFQFEQITKFIGAMQVFLPCAPGLFQPYLLPAQPFALAADEPTPDALEVPDHAELTVDYSEVAPDVASTQQVQEAQLPAGQPALNEAVHDALDDCGNQGVRQDPQLEWLAAACIQHYEQAPEPRRTSYNPLRAAAGAGTALRQPQVGSPQPEGQGMEAHRAHADMLAVWEDYRARLGMATGGAMVESSQQQVPQQPIADDPPAPAAAAEPPAPQGAAMPEVLHEQDGQAAAQVGEAPRSPSGRPQRYLWRPQYNMAEPPDFHTQHATGAGDGSPQMGDNGSREAGALPDTPSCASESQSYSSSDWSSSCWEDDSSTVLSSEATPTAVARHRAQALHYKLLRRQLAKSLPQGYLGGSLALTDTSSERPALSPSACATPPAAVVGAAPTAGSPWWPAGLSGREHVQRTPPREYHPEFYSPAGGEGIGERSTPCDIGSRHLRCWQRPQPQPCQHQDNAPPQQHGCGFFQTKLEASGAGAGNPLAGTSSTPAGSAGELLSRLAADLGWAGHPGCDTWAPSGAATQWAPTGASGWQPLGPRLAASPQRLLESGAEAAVMSRVGAGQARQHDQAGGAAAGRDVILRRRLQPISYHDSGGGASPVTPCQSAAAAAYSEHGVVPAGAVEDGSLAQRSGLGDHLSEATPSEVCSSISFKVPVPGEVITLSRRGTVASSEGEGGIVAGGGLAGEAAPGRGWGALRALKSRLTLSRRSTS